MQLLWEMQYPWEKPFGCLMASVAAGKMAEFLMTSVIYQTSRMTLRENNIDNQRLMKLKVSCCLMNLVTCTHLSM